ARRKEGVNRDSRLDAQRSDWEKASSFLSLRDHRQPFFKTLKIPICQINVFRALGVLRRDTSPSVIWYRLSSGRGRMLLLGDFVGQHPLLSALRVIRCPNFPYFVD
ncbi:MAG: hypothetical protein OSA84_12300, partial [Akkermansiaceae bacterium]|nr:hypothetical protein [Akkermansiaceae bacterium]